MTLRFAGLIAFALFAGACYRPKLGTPGYFCHASDIPACPDGQSCIDGRCANLGESFSAELGSSEHDLGSLPGEDLSSMSPDDLSSPPPPPDFAMASCVATGGSCNYHKDSICCSKYCVYATEKCK